MDWDSPQNEKDTTTTTTTTTTATIETSSVSVPSPSSDSAIYSYISNLSPIEPLRSGTFLPGFQGVNSPPIIFTSPRDNSYRQETYPRRTQHPQLSTAELSEQDAPDSFNHFYGELPVNHALRGQSCEFSLAQKFQGYKYRRETTGQYSEIPFGAVGVSDSQALGATHFLPAYSSQTLRPSNDPVQSNQREYQTNLWDKREIVSKHTDVVEKLNHQSPQKRRKKESHPNDDNECKRCNCKKTNCLKLYCDCFSAGFYCAETCTCQDCFNRPDYEDTVLDTREKIEIKNPLAFAPTIQDGNNSTPSSARHKRGCNCRKTMCLKKYCECYQANIGCSSGCRCEGCENLYGRKQEYGKTKDVSSKGPIHERFGISFDERLKRAASQDSLLQTDLYNPHKFTPQTPSFQYPDLQLPESNLDILSPYGKLPQSYKNLKDDQMLLNARKNLGGGYVHKGLGFPTADTVSAFSPGYGLANSFDLSSLLNYPPRAMPSLAHLHAESGHFPLSSSLNQPSSPFTHVPVFCETGTVQTGESDENLSHRDEDDKQEALELDSSIPLDAVRGTSPGKKCFSTPINSLQEQGSSSFSNLRSDWYATLPSVPSFPPLTPLNDPEDTSSEYMDDPKASNS